MSQAYDQHLNMILGDVEETVTTVEIDEETYEELYKVQCSFLPASLLLTEELLLCFLCSQTSLDIPGFPE